MQIDGRRVGSLVERDARDAELGEGRSDPLRKASKEPDADGTVAERSEGTAVAGEQHLPCMELRPARQAVLCEQ